MVKRKSREGASGFEEVGLQILAGVAKDLGERVTFGRVFAYKLFGWQELLEVLMSTVPRI